MSNRTIIYYKILVSTAATTLGVSDVQSVSSEGQNLLFRHTDVVTNNNPLNGINKVQEKYTIFSWASLKAQFFNSIPDSKFMKMRISFDDANITIFINLNLEE